MADEPGPSGTGSPQPPSLLQEAAHNFEKGLQAIKDNQMEKAVELFDLVRAVRTKHYGDLAPECASAYYRYGAALLYQAQDSTDVLGGGAGSEEPEEDKENDDSVPGGGAAAARVDDDGKGKAPAVEEEEDEQDQEEEGAAATAEQAESDLQLAWENLEAAKVIWQRDSANHAQELADVHMLLSDVCMESDDFDLALAEIESCLGHLGKVAADDDRRIAEAQYKRCMALQFCNRPQEALEAVQAAVACMKKKQQALQEKAAAAEGDEGEEGKLSDQLADVGAVLEDLNDRVAELEGLMSQDADMRQMIKDTLGQLGAVMSGGAHPSQRQLQEAQQPRGSSGQAAFGQPTAPAAAGGASVQNLGVVGRGTKRIKLQPLAPGGPAAAAPASAAPEAGGAGAGGGSAAGEPKNKRSLEDLMGGGSGGEISLGFGIAVPVKGSAPAVKPGAAASQGLPAFLQPQKVQAAYQPHTEPAGTSDNGGDGN